MKFPVQALLISCLLAISSNAFAQQWYHVELIIFERYSGVGEEQWPLMTNIRQGSLSPKMSNTDIQPAELTLTAKANRINNAGDFRVLYHEAWKQPIRSKGSAKTIQINALNNLIEGSLKLYQVSYLHADLDIWFKENEPELQQWQTALPEGIEVSGPRNPNLYEIRRVKSDTINYFDHPRMGALIQLTPVDAPGGAISAAPETYSVQEN
jgi:hypothetical protein